MTCPLFFQQPGRSAGMITTWNSVKAVAAVCTFSNNKKEKKEVILAMLIYTKQTGCLKCEMCK